MSTIPFCVNSAPLPALIADRGYDINRFRVALRKRGIATCIPSHRTENMIGRLKDWRRIATRCDRCVHTFFSAICIAATITCWLQ
jgi:hypothetical protein